MHMPWFGQEQTRFVIATPIISAIFVATDHYTCFAQTNSTANNEIWLGFIGKAELFLLYPSMLCDEYWQSLGLELADPTLRSMTLKFDDDNNLFLVSLSIVQEPSLHQILL